MGRALLFRGDDTKTTYSFLTVVLSTNEASIGATTIRATLTDDGRCHWSGYASGELS